MAITHQKSKAKRLRPTQRVGKTADDRLMTATAPMDDTDLRSFLRNRRADAKRYRDEIIREIAARYFLDEKPWGQANEISRRLNYYARRWPRDRYALTCPADIHETIDGAIWALWSDTEPKILSHRTIYRILRL